MENSTHHSRVERWGVGLHSRWTRENQREEMHEGGEPEWPRL